MFNEKQNFLFGVPYVPIPARGHTLDYTKKSCDPNRVRDDVIPVYMNGPKNPNTRKNTRRRRTSYEKTLITDIRPKSEL